MGERLPGVLVVAFQAPLSFINMELFRHDLAMAVASAGSGLKLVVLEANSVAEIDYSAALMLRDEIEDCHRRGVDFAIARLESVRAQDALDRFGVKDALGADRLYHSVEEAIRALDPSLPSASQRGRTNALVSRVGTVEAPPEPSPPNLSSRHGETSTPSDTNAKTSSRTASITAFLIAGALFSAIAYALYAGWNARPIQHEDAPWPFTQVRPALHELDRAREQSSSVSAPATPATGAQPAPPASAPEPKATAPLTSPPSVKPASAHPTAHVRKPAKTH